MRRWPGRVRFTTLTSANSCINAGEVAGSGLFRNHMSHGMKESPMEGRRQAEKAERFRQLHHGPHILALVNVWDVATARLVEKGGFPAIATSSAAVANSWGYPDGQHISRVDMLSVVERIARHVHLPVSADLEA